MASPSLVRALSTLLLLSFALPLHALAEEGVEECRAAAGCVAGDDVGLLQIPKAHSGEPLVAPVAVAEIETAAAKAASQGECRVGARAWLTQKGLVYLGDTVLPLVVKELVNQSMPAMSSVSNGLKLDVQNLTILALSVENTKLSLVKDTGVRMNISGVEGRISFKFKLQGQEWWNGFINDGGDAIVTIGKRTALSAVMGLKVNAEGKPEVSVSDVWTSLDVADLKVTGATLGDLISSLKSVIAPTIAGQLESKLNSLPDMLNPILAKTSFQIPLPTESAKENGLVADFSVCSVITAADYISVAVPAEVISTTHPELKYTEQPLPIEDAPPASWQDDMMSLTMTKWTLNSAMWLLKELGLLKATMTTAQMPELNGKVLDTALLAEVAPQLAGKDAQDVSVTFVPSATPSVLFSGDKGVEVSAPFQVSFESGAEQLFTVQVPLEASAKPSVASGEGAQRIKVDVQSVKFTPLTLIDSKVGEVNLEKLSDIVDKQLVAPMLKRVLPDGFPIPAAHGLKLTDLAVEVTDSFNIRGDIDWNPTQTLNDFFGGNTAFFNRALEGVKSAANAVALETTA